MKLKIRYENEIQTIELDAKATEEMWVSLSLEGEGLSQKEREELIQKEWNEQFNKDDYYNWHKFNRHRGLILLFIRSSMVPMKMMIGLIRRFGKRQIHLLELQSVSTKYRLLVNRRNRIRERRMHSDSFD